MPVSTDTSTDTSSDIKKKLGEADKQHKLKQDQGLANQVTGGGISRVDLLVESLNQKLSIKAPGNQAGFVPTNKAPILPLRPKSTTVSMAKPSNTAPANMSPVPSAKPTYQLSTSPVQSKKEVAAAVMNIFKKVPNATLTSSSTESSLETADFLKGEWLQEIDADYQAYVAKSSGIRKQYWEEAYSALNALWDIAYYQEFMSRVEDQWKTGAYDNYIYITIPKTAKYPTFSYPQGVMFHIQYNCPASYYYEPAAKRQISIDFSDPRKGYLDEVKAAIKSMHLDIYNIYSTAKKLGRTDIVDGMFYNIASYGCINEKIRHLNDFALKCLKNGLGLPFDQTVQGILADYAKHVYDTYMYIGMPKMDYNALAQYQGGKYFYLEDIVAFGKKNYPNVKSIDNKTINNLEETLEEWGICDRRPTVAQPFSAPASATTYGHQLAAKPAPVVFFGSSLKNSDFVYDDDFDSWLSSFQTMTAPKPAPFVTANPGFQTIMTAPKPAPFVTANPSFQSMMAQSPAMTFSQGTQFVTQHQITEAARQAFYNIGNLGPYQSLRALVVAKVKYQSDFDATVWSINSAFISVLQDPNPSTTSIKTLSNPSSIKAIDLLNVMLSGVGSKLNSTAALCNTSANRSDVIMSKPALI